MNTRLLVELVFLTILAILGFAMYGDLFDPWVLPPREYSDSDVAAFCGKLSQDLQRLSWFQLAIGWFVISIAAICGIFGSILGPAEPNTPSVFPARTKPYRGFLLVALASVLTASGMQILDRQAKSAEAAAKATLAFRYIGLDERKAYNMCIEARALWLLSRKDMNRVQELVGLTAQNRTVNGPHQ